MVTPKPTHCEECGKPLNEKNKLVTGGGNLSYKGKWTTWGMGACCKKPMTPEDFKDFLHAVYKAENGLK